MEHYVRLLMDEVFGVRNFRNIITRIKCNPKNFKRYSYSISISASLSFDIPPFRGMRVRPDIITRAWRPARMDSRICGG